MFLMTILFQFFVVSSTYGHCVQLKLSQYVTFIVSFLIMWPRNRHYINTNQLMVLPSDQFYKTFISENTITKGRITGQIVTSLTQTKSK